MLSSESITKTLLAASLIDNLLWCKVRDEFLNISIITLGNKELARSNIKKSNTRLLLTKTYRGKVYILLILNKILVQSNTRRNKLNNTTLNKTLNGFRIL